VRDRALLLSLRPRFAQAILDGTKTIDLRRRVVRAAPGTPLLLYASAPLMAVVGTARLQRAEVCEADVAWSNHGHALGLDRREFDDYLAGRSACLLLLDDVCALDQPISLKELGGQAGFRPPQSYRYVSASDPALVRDLGTSSISGGSRSPAS
jgi:predicted transcriptional regulator